MSNKKIEFHDHRQFYNEYFRKINYINNLKLDRCINILSSIIQLNIKEPKILDLGCGNGWLTSILGHIGPTIGVDFSDYAIKEAEQKYTHVGFMQQEIFNWDYPQNEFDIIVSQEVIEHFIDQKRFLNIANDMLKKNGYLILTTPNSKTFLAMPESDRLKWANQPIENWLNFKKLKSLLIEEKFEIISLITIIPKYGNKGIYKIWNSNRIFKLLKLIKINNLFIKLRLKLGYGLHILAVAKKV